MPASLRSPSSEKRIVLTFSIYCRFAFNAPASAVNMAAPVHIAHKTRQPMIYVNRFMEGADVSYEDEIQL